MKSVWVLEILRTKEDLDKQLNDCRAMIDLAQDEKCMEMLNSVIKSLEQDMRDYPDGKFVGIEGKIYYCDFTYCARECMRRNKDKKFRVVKAEIEDNAKYWMCYKNPIINEGVLRYLYATLY